MTKKIVLKAKQWWLYLIFGCLVLLAGGNFLANPNSTIGSVMPFLSSHFIIYSAIALFLTIYDKKINSYWVAQTLLYVLSLIMGILLMTKLYLVLTYTSELTYTAFLANGAAIIISSLTFKKLKILTWWIPIVFGIFVITTASITYINPLLELNVDCLNIAFSIICCGIFFLIQAFLYKALSNGKRK